MTTPSSLWSAPVRFAEVDQQGIVFNSHYLLYCDEAMGTFCDERELRAFAAGVRLVTSTQKWTGPARWGDVIEVTVHCSKIGRSSAVMAFEITAGGRPCCSVETVYVLVGAGGQPEAIADDVRARLGG
jgi:acyl-CoA thioester hydrolase